MPPKITYSREKIIEVAFELLKKGGPKIISARNIGKELGMSSMIIYSNFQNMEELVDNLVEKSWNLLGGYQRRSYSPYKILNLGLGYIQFALDEKILFKWMFQEENVTKKYWKYLLNELYKEIYADLKNIVGPGSTEKQLRRIFEDLWIYVHGLAVLLNSGALHLEGPDLIKEKLMELFKRLTGNGE